MLREFYPHTKKLLLDSNLLVILIGGKVRLGLLKLLSPGNSHFTEGDLVIIEKLLYEFESVVTTPYILTEVSSLINSKVDKNSQPACRKLLAAFIDSSENKHLEPKVLSQDSNFFSFGIADVSILRAYTSDTLVLTEDGPLIGLLRGKNVSNYIDLKNQLSQIR